MREFTLYGLDAGHRLLSTERIRAADEETARAAARARLERYPIVELWEGPTCIWRKSRATGASLLLRTLGRSTRRSEANASTWRKAAVQSAA
jgi:hypothetical protein